MTDLKGILETCNLFGVSDDDDDVLSATVIVVVLFEASVLETLDEVMVSAA